MSIFLGVNIDHIATLRQARGTKYPSLIDAALICENSGADSITLHLREDRRHIQDNDVIELKSRLKTKMNLEMAATDEMLKIASNVLPEDCCLVPEKRQELTTEGGLDVASQIVRMKEVCTQLSSNNIKTSLFIDADKINYDNYYEKAIELIRPEGIIAIDNVLLFGSVLNPNCLSSDLQDRISTEDIESMKKLNLKIKKDTRVDISMLQIADGLTLVRKKPAGNNV